MPEREDLFGVAKRDAPRIGQQETLEDAEVEALRREPDAEFNLTEGLFE